MRSYVFILLAFFILSSCDKGSKEELLTDNGCIQRFIKPLSAHSINPSDLPVVNNLLITNGFDISNLRYFQYIHDTFQTLYPPYVRYDQKQVKADQYTNGLRIFRGEIGALFYNDTLHFKGGKFTNGTSLDTAPQLQLGQVRKLYIDKLEYFEHKGNQYKDSCLKAEFGYINLNRDNTNLPEVLVKAWVVSPQVYDYPVACFKDLNGELLSYSNGIVNFK